MIGCEGLEEDKVERATALIGKYIDKHPNPVIGGMNVQWEVMKPLKT